MNTDSTDNNTNPATGAPPLSGLRVLDIATYIAGPYAATILAEFGAEVIKVELPKVGDPFRRFGTPDACGETLAWLSEARNKKSITLNFKKPEGVALFKQLVAKADVVTENFQPGTLENWGIGYETLKQINPKLIMLRISGFGQTGPYRNRPGFGRIANALGGISYLAGFPDRPPVTPGSATLADYLSGLYGAFGILMALKARDRDGVGQTIDIGLYESIFRILDELAPSYDKTGFIRERMGPATVNAVPHSHYPTADDRWVAIACTNDKIWQRLAILMGVPEIAGDGRLGNIRQREAARQEVDDMVTAWSRQFSQQDVLQKCEQAQVPCGPVAAIDEIFTDPQFAARENILRFADDRVGELAIPNVMPRLDGTPGKVTSLGPTLGANNEEIYGGLLGLSEAERTQLQEAGVI